MGVYVLSGDEPPDLPRCRAIPEEDWLRSRGGCIKPPGHDGEHEVLLSIDTASFSKEANAPR
jgi:hypothetical protein